MSAFVSDDDFRAMFEALGATKMAQEIGVTKRAVELRRVRLENKIGQQVKAPHKRTTRLVSQFRPNWIEIEVDNGIVLVGSDAHIWPGKITTAWRAFEKFTKDMQPKVVIMNGDVIDGAKISRHPPINWERQPNLVEEIEAASALLGNLERLTSPGCELIWSLGNHDQRLETRLATVAPEYAKLKGVHLKDHFGERWRPCYSAIINDDVVVKHRHKGGVHALHNSVLWAGKTMVTSHLHSLNVRAFTDYNGTRFGVDTGTLSEPYLPQFQYVEDNPVNWRSGFVVMTFIDGELQWPEVVNVVREGVVGFRGQHIQV